MKKLRVLLAWAVIAAPASAQELVANGQFDTDLSGWSTFRDITFDPGEDVGGALDSGAARITNMEGPNVAFFQNVEVPFPQSYALRFSVMDLFGPTGLNDPIRILVQYRGADSGDCNSSTENVIRSDDFFVQPLGPGWNTLTPPGIVLAAPPSTACIHLSFRLAIPEYPGYYLDGVSLQSLQAVLAQDRIFLNGFDGSP